MKTLLMMRHAKSSWKHENLSDHERPLKKRGEQDAIQMGEHIRQLELTPQRIISSSAKRAYQTATLFAEAAHYEGEISVRRDLYCGAEPDDYLAVLRQLDDADMCVMVVGHNPDLEVFLESLTGALQSLPTAAIAHITLPINSWQELTDAITGKLVNLWVPQEP